RPRHTSHDHQPGGGRASPPASFMPGIAMLGFCHRLLALAFALGVLAALPTLAHAGPYEDAISRFVTDDFDDTTAAINGVAASGHPLAAVVIGALGDGRLVFSAQAKKVFLRDSSDRLIDAVTGQPVTAAAPND